MTIRNKLLLSFISMILVFSTLSVYLVIALKEQGNVTVFAFKQPLNAVSSSRSAGDIFNQANQFAAGITQMTQPQSSDAVKRDFKSIITQFEKQLTIAKDNSFSTSMAQEIQQIETLEKRWSENVLKRISGTRQGTLVSQIVLDQQQTDIVKRLNKLVETTINDAQIRANEVETSISDKLTVSLSLLGVIALASLIAAIVLASKLTKPIHALIDAVVELSRGDGDLTTRLAMKGDDEVAQLSAEFNEFIAKVHVTVSDISASVSTTKKRLANFSDVAVNTQRGTSQQKVEIDNISSAMSQVNSSMNTVEQSAGQVKTQADGIHEETQVSVQLVEEAVNEIANLSADIEKTSNVIYSLSNSSTQIADVLNVIEAIADQTNLLALNAAIEAARAGESGRGFSVVADEIRTLAMKTQESTTNIHDTISTILQQAQDAKNMMESGTERAHVCVDKNSEVATALNQVLERAVGIKERSEFVSVQTQEQKTATAHVNGYLEQIIDIAEQTAKGSMTLDTNSTQIIASMDEVNQNVAQFKL